ncbi:MAG TPA: carboxypeptidase-like regulatory domain-containing protein, partial [Telluria sp.]
MAAISTIAVPAMAQSNVVGSVYGTATPGAAVVLKNLGTNQTRTVTADPAGKFQASGMAIGSWQVTTGGKVATVEVIAGQGAEAVLDAPVAVQSVQISGRRSRIDVSNATNGAVFTARELSKLPIARNVDAIIQLAPNTTKGDPTYAAGASFAGGGVSENAYYINGFPVTNPLTQLGASELPFGAIAQASVLVGGFGPEFGRSVGGVVNIVGKSGSNNWEVGAMASISPSKLRSSYKDRYYANTGVNPATDGTLRVRREDNELTQVTRGAYVGGPIIQDKLFM